jgi:methyl-accepting chemotaxis protein
MTKILSLVILLWVLYGVSVFLFPDVAAKIDTLIGKPWFSDSIKKSKSSIDSTVTNIPSASDFKSWTLDIKNKIVDWVEMTKDTINSIRSWAQKVEETYDEALDTYNNIKGTMEDAQKKAETVQWVVESISQLTGSGS